MLGKVPTPQHPMLNVQQHNPRKRRNPESQTLQQGPSIYKKQKHNHNGSSQFPPAFWDNLSKIDLTTRALKELNRRNTQSGLNSRPTPRPFTRAIVTQERKTSEPLTPAADYLRHCDGTVLKSIKQTTRHGGPDLSDLRGFPPSTPPIQDMNSSKSSSRGPKGSSTPTSNNKSSTNPNTDPTTKTKSTGPYNSNFQQNLIDHGVYPAAYEYPDGRIPKKPDNWEEIQKRLRRPRPSLSPSKFSEEDHEKFVRADAHAAKEKQVTTSVIPVIEGDVGDAKCVSGGIPFTNLNHLTDGTLVPGNPDIYYGARPEQLDRRVRDELNGHIVPSRQYDLPIVPNFFLAAKGPDGSLAVAGRQASYDGALGARGMHSLHSYGQVEPVVDNNAYTITSIYHGGTLKMYTSHASQSASPGQRPEYYTHQLNTWGMTGNAETFRQGATFYRNARDWTKEQRDQAIRCANEKAVGPLAEVLAVDPTLQQSPSCSNETTRDEVFGLNEETPTSLPATVDTTVDPEESDRSCEPTLGTRRPKRPSQHSKRLGQTQKRRRNAGTSKDDLSQQLELQASCTSGLSQQLADQDLEPGQDRELSQIGSQPIDPTETSRGRTHLHK